jgi:hypothetical protein
VWTVASGDVDSYQAEAPLIALLTGIREKMADRLLGPTNRGGFGNLWQGHFVNTSHGGGGGAVSGHPRIVVGDFGGCRKLA